MSCVIRITNYHKFLNRIIVKSCYSIITILSQFFCYIYIFRRIWKFNTRIFNHSTQSVFFFFRPATTKSIKPISVVFIIRKILGTWRKFFIFSVILVGPYLNCISHAETLSAALWSTIWLKVFVAPSSLQIIGSCPDSIHLTCIITGWIWLIENSVRSSASASGIWTKEW